MRKVTFKNATEILCWPQEKPIYLTARVLLALKKEFYIILENDGLHKKTLRHFFIINQSMPISKMCLKRPTIYDYKK